MNELPRIASFSIDHQALEPGLYISRQDGPVVTYDLRLKRPNREAVLSTGACHAIEHIGATYLRAHDPKRQMIYFGPMGCRTGFYVLYLDSCSAEQVREQVTAAFRYVRDFSGEIPGASAAECGNYRDMDLEQAKREAALYVQVLEKLTGDKWYEYQNNKY